MKSLVKKELNHYRLAHDIGPTDEPLQTKEPKSSKNVVSTRLFLEWSRKPGMISLVDNTVQQHKHEGQRAEHSTKRILMVFLEKIRRPFHSRKVQMTRKLTVMKLWSSRNGPGRLAYLLSMLKITNPQKLFCEALS